MRSVPTWAGLLGWSTALSLLVAFAGASSCSAVEVHSSAVDPDAGTAGAGGDGGSGGNATDFDAGTVDDPCACSAGAHNDVIYVLSDTSEIWQYDPETHTMGYLTTVLCNGADQPYSMAVDHRGFGWVLSAETNLIFKVELKQNGACEPSVYVPYQADFDLFGMAFSAVEEGPSPDCPPLYALSYSGEGPFKEGPGLGSLARIDAQTGELTVLGPTDYDGGELAGSGDGRLFALAGDRPVKLVEYDRATAAAVKITPLAGLSKTNASAMSFFAGALYLFTEALPAACPTCLEEGCEEAWTDCLDDPACSEDLQCTLDTGDFADDCGGLMPSELQECLIDCGSSCLLPSYQKVSRVTRIVFDPSAPDGFVATTTLAEAPIRVVGAGNSVCVPVVPK